VLPAPSQPAIDHPYGILITGVGGTGVVTIGALLGMAAHLEGKGVSVLDMTGLAQKGGAVFSHVRIAHKPEDINAVRIPAGDAHLVLGADFVVTGSFDALAKIRAGQTDVIVNRHETMTADFSRNPDLVFPKQDLTVAIEEAAGAGRATFLDATEIATALLGDAIASNLFLLGFAVQRGLVPVSADALERAIELNNVSVAFNKQALLWGRRAGHDLAAVQRLAAPPPPPALSHSLDESIARRVEFLTAYQDDAYAARYRALVERVRAVEAQRVGGDALADAVARYYFKLLAYKDEYEVARLYTDGSFRRQLESQFEGDYRLELNLAPPLFAARDEAGHLKKRTFGPWMLKAMRLLARLKGLRGTSFDIFGRTEERRQERRLIVEYEALITELLERLARGNHALAVELAGIPEHIRGYGHVKQAQIVQAKAREAALLAQLRDPAPTMATAAE
jgi:indolepyruvate ferredoxin oxidoreductase